MVWGLPRCVWARESTAPAQGNQFLSRELPASALCPGTVEVTNRFKGLDLIDRVPEELWTEVCDIVQVAGIKIISIQLPKDRPQLWGMAEEETEAHRGSVNARGHTAGEGQSQI